MGSRSLFYGNLPLKKSWDYQVRGCGQAHGVRPPWAWPGLDVAAGTDRDWPDEGMGVCLGGHLCVVAGVSPLRPKLGARLAFPHWIVQVVTFARALTRPPLHWGLFLVQGDDTAVR